MPRGKYKRTGKKRGGYRKIYKGPVPISPEMAEVLALEALIDASQQAVAEEWHRVQRRMRRKKAYILEVEKALGELFLKLKI